MSYVKACTLLNLMTIVMICLAILMSESESKVEASRVLRNSQEFVYSKANHIETHTSSAYDHAKNTMSFWLQRLPSGPSPKGPGH
uniref:Uncharacterized protein LOC101505812 n=1 Tax=Cicer arietinum TaxID=3827 RepID=A0A1S2YNB5_CICAR|nr:uncharacterized protein LOC101505812 [Cicer arietinum]